MKNMAIVWGGNFTFEFELFSINYAFPNDSHVVEANLFIHLQRQEQIVASFWIVFDSFHLVFIHAYIKP